MSKTLLALATLAALSTSCGPPAVRPASYADPDVACPGGRKDWTLSIVDERAETEGADLMTAAIHDGITKSFPGCHWSSAPAPSGETITIEVHRFRSSREGSAGDSSGAWEAAVEWTVRAVDAGGRTLTEFQANEEVSRPNYRGSNNEKESLSEAYQKALERTVKGLTALPANGAIRLPARTLEFLAALPVRSAGGSKSSGASTCRAAARPLPGAAALERDSHWWRES